MPRQDNKEIITVNRLLKQSLNAIIGMQDRLQDIEHFSKNAGIKVPSSVLEALSQIAVDLNTITPELQEIETEFEVLREEVAELY